MVAITQIPAGFRIEPVCYSNRSEIVKAYGVIFCFNLWIQIFLPPNFWQPKIQISMGNSKINQNSVNGFENSFQNTIRVLRNPLVTPWPYLRTWCSLIVRAKTLAYKVSAWALEWIFFKITDTSYSVARLKILVPALNIPERLAVTPFQYPKFSAFPFYPETHDPYKQKYILIIITF